MQKVSLFVRGFGLGCMLAIPLGSAGMMAVRDAMLQGFRIGFFAACAPMTWDLFIASFMCFGMGWFVKRFHHLRHIAQIMAAVILVYVAGRIYFDRATLFSETPSNMHAYLDTLRIVALNTAAIICSMLITIPVFGGEPFENSDTSGKISFLGGIAFGDCFLWIIILAISQKLGSLFATNISHVNTVFAVIFIAIACGFIYKTYRELAH